MCACMYVTKRDDNCPDDLMSFTDNEGALCSSKWLWGLYFTQSIPGTEITDWFSPLEPEGQFPALCPDPCPSSVSTAGAHLQTQDGAPQTLKRKNDKQRCRALPGRRGHRMLMQS